MLRSSSAAPVFLASRLSSLVLDFQNSDPRLSRVLFKPLGGGSEYVEG